MATAKLFFATNRNHEGKDRWKPTGYGEKFSSNGRHNLRFGEVGLSVDEAKVKAFLRKTVHKRKGDGEGLASYLTKLAKKAKVEITAYRDRSHKTRRKPIAAEKNASTRAFRKLKARMEKAADILVYIHGYNVDWNEAVGSALSLQYMLNRSAADSPGKEIMVFLFSWPSDGSYMPFAAYWSDRKDAGAAGLSVGRGILKLQDFLGRLRKKAKSRQDRPCNRDIHILCHSMGNFVLQNALPMLLEERPGPRHPRLFKHIFLCAADVDDDVLEPGRPMERLNELGLYVSVYFNHGDVALRIADATKGHPDRLGQTGVAHDYIVHRKIHQIDCSPIVGGAVEHSYYMWATVNDDIRMSLNDLSFDGQGRKRVRESKHSWTLE